MTVIGHHSLGIYTVVLLPLLSFSVKMTVSRMARCCRPDGWEFFRNARLACDGTPKRFDAFPDYYVKHGAFCPWNAGLLDCASGCEDFEPLPPTAANGSYDRNLCIFNPFLRLRHLSFGGCAQHSFGAASAVTSCSSIKTPHWPSSAPRAGGWRSARIKHSRCVWSFRHHSPGKGSVFTFKLRRVAPMSPSAALLAVAARSPGDRCHDTMPWSVCSILPENTGIFQLTFPRVLQLSPHAPV